MSSLLRFYILLTIFYIYIIVFANQAIAVSNGNPIYCMGPCGIISTTCSCTSQDCHIQTPYPQSPYYCRFLDTGTDCGFNSDGYTCKSCMNCSSVQNSDSCTNLGYYSPTCYTGDCPGGGGSGGDGGYNIGGGGGGYRYSTDFSVSKGNISVTVGVGGSASSGGSGGKGGDCARVRHPAVVV